MEADSKKQYDRGHIYATDKELFLERMSVQVDVVVLNRSSVGLLYFIDKLDVVSLDRLPLR